MATPTEENPKPIKLPFHAGQTFDVYVSEPGGRTLLYKKVIFKAAIALLTSPSPGSLPRFLEIVQFNGDIVYVPTSSIVKFCLHGTTLTHELLGSKGTEKC